MIVIELMNTSQIGKWISDEAYGTWEVIARARTRKVLDQNIDYYEWNVKLYRHPNPDTEERELLIDRTFPSYADMNEEIFYDNERVYFDFYDEP